MRKLFLFLVAVALILFGAAYPLLLPRPSPVTMAAYNRIEKGMSLEEVEAVLGGPEGDYTTGPTEFSGVLGGGFPCPRALLRERTWTGDELDVSVTFDDADIVRAKGFLGREKEKLGVIDLLRWRLNRLKGRWFPPKPGPLPPLPSPEPSLTEGLIGAARPWDRQPRLSRRAVATT
jgi:hypothetical protein